MKFFIYLVSFFINTRIYGVIFDDFTNLAFHKSFYPHNTILNDAGISINITRNMPKNDDSVNSTQFILSRKNLFYDGSLPLSSIARVYGEPYTLKYGIAPVIDISKTPILKINFENMSQPFCANIFIGSDGGALSLFDVEFDPINCSPTLDLSNPHSIKFTNNEFSNHIGKNVYGDINLNRINSIDFRMNTLEDELVNFSISSIELVEGVPEPFSVLSMGIALITLKRKKKNIKLHSKI